MTTVHYSNLEDRYWIRDGEDRILWFDSILEAQDYAREAEIDAAKLDGMAEALDWVRDLLSDAAQSDCEHGVRWLNEAAAAEYLIDYPNTAEALAKISNATIMDILK